MDRGSYYLSLIQRLFTHTRVPESMLLTITYHENINNWATAGLIKSMEDRGHRVMPIRLADVGAQIPHRFIFNDVDFSDAQGMIVRTIGFGTGDQITFRISVLEHFEDAGIYVMNPAYSFRRAKDKYATLTALHKAGIKVPKTFIGENLEAGIEFIHENDDVIIKPLIGARGLGAIRAEHPELTYRAMKFVHQLGQVLYVQEMVNKPGRDIRAFVIGGQFIAAMYRYLPEGHEGEWRTNVHGGGRAELAEDLPEEYIETAIKTAEVMNLDYTGVDILESEDGPVVIEANAAPSWSALARVTELDIAGMIVDHLVEKVKK